MSSKYIQDDRGRIIRYEAPDYWKDFYYNEDGQMTYSMDSRGEYVIYRYNGKGQFLYLETNVLKREYIYDQEGNLIKSVETKFPQYQYISIYI